MHPDKQKTYAVRGFGVLQVVVAGAILAIVMTGALKMINSGLKSSRQIASMTDFDNFVRIAQLFLADSNFCRSAFQNRTFDPTAGTLATQAIPNASDSASIILYTPNASTQVYAQNGTAISAGVVLETMEIRTFVSITPTSYKASLQFSMVHQNGLRIVREIPMALAVASVNATTVKITACNALAPSSSGASGGGTEGINYIGSRVEHYQTPKSSLEITVPTGTKLIRAEMVGQNLNSYGAIPGVPGATWDENTEDKMETHFVVDLNALTTTGFYSVIGGSSGTNVALFQWQDQALGDSTPTVTGDTSASNAAGAANFRPYFTFDTTTRAFTLRTLNTFSSAQYNWLFEFYGSN